MFTAFFFVGPFSMSFIFGMVMIYYTLNSLELYFGKRQADFATLLIFNAVWGLLISYIANDYAIMQS